MEIGKPSGEVTLSNGPLSPTVTPEALSGQPQKTKPIFAQSQSAESYDQSDTARSNGLLANRIFFVLIYLVFAAPTYVLPYFGSNSALINVTGAAMGLGALPQFWYHLVALYLLVVVAWLRGAQTGRAWIAIFPFFAGIFDMVPGLNWFLLIPTGFHVVALIMGVKGDVVHETNAGAPRQRFAISSAGLIALVVLSVIKTQSFFQTAERGPSWERAPVKSIQNGAAPVPTVNTAIDTEYIRVESPLLPEVVASFIRSRGLGFAISLDKNCGFDFKTGSHPFFVTGDFDGDGRPDYAIDVVEKGSLGKIFVFLSDGTTRELGGWEHIYLINKRGLTPTFDGPNVDLKNDAIGGVACEKSSAMYVFNKTTNGFDQFFTSD